MNLQMDLDPDTEVQDHLRLAGRSLKSESIHSINGRDEHSMSESQSGVVL